MACGCPTILSTSSSLPEIGSDSAVYFKTGVPESLSEAILRVLNDGELAEKLRQRGQARAETFTWLLSATRLAEVYRSI